MQEPILFSDLIAETKDGEWGEGQEAPGHVLCDVIRGTDFADLHAPGIELPQRWIPEHLVARKALTADDILIETAGGTAKQSTGRTALITKEFLDSRGDRPVLCSSFARHLRVERDKVHPVYLYYLLQALYASGYMGVFNLQHTGVARFQFTAFRTKTRLTLHENAAQPRIAATLKSYDDLIANNQRRIALLESMAEEIYREWFVRMRFPRYQDTRWAGGLPVGWEVRRLSEVANVNANSIRRGAEPELIAYLDISAVGTNSFDEPNAMRHQDAPGRARRLVRDGDIIWSAVRPGNKTYCLMLDPPDNLVASTGFAVISPKPGTPFSYLSKAVTTQEFTDQMVAVAKGAAYPATSFDDFESAQIVWPSSELLTTFHDRTEPMLRQVALLRAQCKVLAQQRDALLPRLISGKLRVDSLDIQFPPSMQPPPAKAAQRAAQSR
jgi:type I restriction enzyme S subunit